MPVALSLDGVDFAYGQGPQVLSGVDLRVEQGEFVAIAGPNGGGKTTLLRLALGLERPTVGEVSLYGEPARSFHDRTRIGYLAQRSRIGVHAPATVREVVEAGRAPLRPLGRLRREDHAAVDEALERVALSGLARRRLGSLSGGQQQRAFIAKALAAHPALLVLDEPTTGVDVEAQEALGALLHRLHEELGVTILYVSHEFGSVERYVERLVLVRERIVFDGPPSQLPGMWHDPSHMHA
ncbi:MAG TPA: metal ABC transporter ATP-binding protein [Gaiellaceae bacterium]|nr:metal ABC transporter ATP-binding protein [Gaiellaceae bacterium]